MQLDSCFKTSNFLTSRLCSVRLYYISEDGPKTREINEAIAFMIVKDYQPFSIVEDEGFIHLMKLLAPKYKMPTRKAAQKLVDDKYTKTAKKVKQRIVDRELTITTDIWTDTHTTKSYLGVTCHFLDLALPEKLQSIDLAVYVMDKRHNSGYISACFEEVLKEWAIPKEHVIMVVSDHAPNMVKAVVDTFTEDKHIGCVAHAVNLVAKKACESVKGLPDLFDKVKWIVAFFRRSTTTSDSLHKLQQEDDPNKKPLRMVSYVPTRWNSEYFMLVRFLELFKYVKSIMADQDRSAEMIREVEKAHLEEVIKLLEPLNEVTKDLSGEEYPTVSRVLPIINCLNNCISIIKPTSQMGRSLQSALLNEIDARFHTYRTSHVYGPSMILDPRFKDVHFKKTEERDLAIEYIINMIAQQSNDSDDEEFLGEEPPKKINSGNGVWSYHQQIVQRYNNQKVTLRTSGAIRKEIELYIKGIEPMTCKIFDYWEAEKNRLPLLHEVAMKLLPRIATSVPSERLFSKAGRLLNETRSCLDPARVNRIIFLHNVDYSTFKNVN